MRKAPGAASERDSLARPDRGRCRKETRDSRPSMAGGCARPHARPRTSYRSTLWILQIPVRLAMRRRFGRRRAVRTWRLSLSRSSPSPMTRDVRPRGVAAPLARRVRPAHEHGEAVPAAPQRVHQSRQGKRRGSKPTEKGEAFVFRTGRPKRRPSAAGRSGLRISTHVIAGPTRSSNVTGETVGPGPRRADEPPSIRLSVRQSDRPCPRERVRPGPETA